MNFMITQVELNAMIQDKETAIISLKKTLDVLNNSLSQITNENTELNNKIVTMVIWIIVL